MAFQHLKLCTFCTICMFLIEAVCARRIESEDRIKPLWVSTLCVKKDAG